MLTEYKWKHEDYQMDGEFGTIDAFDMRHAAHILAEANAMNYNHSWHTHIFQVSIFDHAGQMDYEVVRKDKKSPFLVACSDFGVRYDLNPQKH